jgi:hypothetical protein
MITVRPVQGWRPTSQQELLLRAALSQGDEVLRSWQQWKKADDLDHLDGGSARLLPLLYHNLKIHNVEDPIMARLKEEYVHAWSNNELLFHDIAALLRIFQAAGVETILLKGAALALHFYVDAGLRPMSDVDILVRPEKAKLAIKLLHEAGWKTNYESPESLLPYQHSVDFSDGRGHRLDLHWKVLWDGLQDVSDHDFWESALPVEINNVPTSILNPTDQLLHVCVHGAAWNDLPPLRWVADALIITRTAKSEINWNRLIEQIQKRRLMLPMRDTLGYLQNFPGITVPTDVLSAIRNMPASRLERILYRIRTGPNIGLHGLHIVYYWFNAWRFSQHAPFHYKLLDFLRFLKCFLGVEHLWQTPFYMIFKGTRLVKRIFFQSTGKEIRG